MTEPRISDIVASDTQDIYKDINQKAFAANLAWDFGDIINANQLEDELKNMITDFLNNRYACLFTIETPRYSQEQSAVLEKACKNSLNLDYLDIIAHPELQPNQMEALYKELLKPDIGICSIESIKKVANSAILKNITPETISNAINQIKRMNTYTPATPLQPNLQTLATQTKEIHQPSNQTPSNLHTISQENGYNTTNEAEH